MDEKTRYERAQDWQAWALQLLEQSRDGKTLADAVKLIIAGGVREIARN